MADYYPLIARAVAGLDKNTGENRRALYERARAALVAQLRGVDPPLEETEVTRERLALEESIRKVEAEAARRARTEASQPAPPPSPPAASPPPPPPAPSPSRPPLIIPMTMPPPQRPAAPPPPPPPPPPSPPASRPGPSPFTVPQPVEPRGMPSSFNLPPPQPTVLPPPQPNVPPPPRFEPRRAPGGPPPPPPPPRAPVRPRPPVSGESLNDLRRDLAAAPPQAPSPRAPSPPRTPPQAPPDDPFADLPVAHDFDRLDTGDEPRIDPRALRAPREKEPPYNLEPPPEPDEPPRKRGRLLTRNASALDEAGGMSYGGIIKAAIAAVLLMGLIGFGYWQRSTLVGLYQALRGSPTQTTRPAATPAGQSQPKIADRIGQPSQATGPGVAQRVVLYEEEPTDPQGKRYIGSAIWRTETVSPGPGQPPELAVRADVEIPERRITMKFSIRRNTDSTLPASHTVEIMFNLPPDFAGGGIANVPGILMKQSEQTRGVPLAGLAVKVMTGFFLIGLSATEADLQRNIQLLKERAWFDIPVVYGNNRRAILALEKGTPGERAFAEAFATWKQ